MDNQNHVIQTVAAVMTESFKVDPGSIVMLEGLKNPDNLLNAHALLHSTHAMQTKSLRILDDDPRAFMVGYDSIDESKILERMLHLKIVLKTLACLEWKHLRRMIKNTRRINKVLNLNWYREYIKGRHYRIKIIAIDKELRGSGAFRRLITPVLEYADRENIPVVLETLNPVNVGLYEHFGFTLIKTISHPAVHAEQYCMIRWAQNNSR
jgi:GNAT superfamily N-acetyltransferase